MQGSIDTNIKISIYSGPHGRHPGVSGTSSGTSQCYPRAPPHPDPLSSLSRLFFFSPSLKGLGREAKRRELYLCSDLPKDKNLEVPL